MERNMSGQILGVNHLTAKDREEGTAAPPYG